MNANQIINDSMSLEEKLAAIDKAMEQAVVDQKRINPNVPIDPADLTQCEGCQ